MSYFEFYRWFISSRWLLRGYYIFFSYIFGGYGVGLPIMGIGLGVGIPVYAGMRGLNAYLERRDWIRRTVETNKTINQSTSNSKQG